MFADLHLHTNFSDGTYTPEELVGHAQRQGLGALALTDHDTVEGCARMSAACAHAGLEFIPGTELTAEVDGNELHLLAYFVDTQNPRLLAQMSRFQRVRQSRIQEMVARLNQLDGTVAKAGAFAGCVSDLGVFDMVGNLHEWTADPNGTFQGGYYQDTHENGDGCTYKTMAHAAWYHDYSTGFRCCADVDQ